MGRGSRSSNITRSDAAPAAREVAIRPRRYVRKASASTVADAPQGPSALMQEQAQAARVVIPFGETRTFYHISAYEDEYSIDSQGLCTRRPDDGYSMAEQVGNVPAVYMLGEIHPDTLTNDRFSVWEITLDHTDTDLFHDTMNGATPSYYTTQDVPRGKMKLISE